MTPYHAQHADLVRAVAEILVRDYIAPSETADTVEEWYGNHQGNYFVPQNNVISLMEPSELAALIADVEGYEKR